jgi:hypothetical protein
MHALVLGCCLIALAARLPALLVGPHTCARAPRITALAEHHQSAASTRRAAAGLSDVPLRRASCLVKLQSEVTVDGWHQCQR